MGANGDDDSKSGTGISRGAIYLLFLHRNGTVRAEQKISDTHGGLQVAFPENAQFGRHCASSGDVNNEYVLMFNRSVCLPEYICLQMLCHVDPIH